MFKIKSMEKICRICKNERRYDEYHKLYKRCDKCNVRCSLKYYYANKEKELEKRKKYYYNKREKIIDIEKNRREVHKNEIDELKNKIQELTNNMEMLKTSISVS